MIPSIHRQACVAAAALAWSPGLAAGQQSRPNPPPPAGVGEGEPPGEPPGDPAGEPAGEPAPQAPKSLEQRVEELELQLQLLRLQLPEEPAPAAPQASAAATSANALNPTVTVAGNGLYRLDDRRIWAGEARIDNNFNLREVEVDLRAAVDPFADGVVILAFPSEVPGQFEVEAEEAFVTIKRLPVPLLDDPPGGLKLKVGRFRTEVGRINRLHLHDLPQATRPLVTDEFFGEDGYIANGLSAQFFLPTPFDEESAVELTAQVLTGGGVPIADGPAQSPAAVGNLRWFRTFAQAHNFDVSLIYHFGFMDDRLSHTAHTLGGDFLYKYKPARGGEFHSVVVGGQVLAGLREVTTLVDRDGDGQLDLLHAAWSAPVGYFAFAQVQVASTVYAGARWDDTAVLADERLRRRALSAWLTWYPSEFLRFRVGYEHRFSDLHGEDGLNSAFAELNFILGAHPPEPFWVNK